MHPEDSYCLYIVCKQLVSILKLSILVEIEAWEKFYRRHIVDIPRIKFWA